MQGMLTQTESESMCACCLDGCLRWRILLHELVKAVHVIVRQAFALEPFLAGHALNKKLRNSVLSAAC
jgi:hypothetical protein